MKYIIEKMSLVFWIICILGDLTYYLITYIGAINKQQVRRFTLGDSSLLLVIINYFIPMVLNISEAWANVALTRLIENLQVSDYNRKLKKQQNQNSQDGEKRQSGMSKSYFNSQQSISKLYGSKSENSNEMELDNNKKNQGTFSKIFCCFKKEHQEKNVQDEAKNIKMNSKEKKKNRKKST